MLSIVLIYLFFFLFAIWVASDFVTIAKSGYEVTEDAYHYTLSAISQTVATLVGLIAVFSIYEIRKNEKNDIKFNYFLLFIILLFGSGVILYSLCCLPFFCLVENPLTIIMNAVVGSMLLLMLLIGFVVYMSCTEEMG